MTQSGSCIDPWDKLLTKLSWVKMQTGNVRDTAEAFLGFQKRITRAFN